MAAIVTALTRDELEALEAWARDARGSVLEIGAYYGASTLALARAAKARGECVLSIDHHRGDGQAGYAQTAQPFLDNIREYADTIIPLVADTRTVARFRQRFARDCGMAFIDGDHRLAAVQHDIDLARWFVPAGRLAFHDFGRFDVAVAITSAGLRVVERVATMALCEVTG